MICRCQLIINDLFNVWVPKKLWLVLCSFVSLFWGCSLMIPPIYIYIYIYICNLRMQQTVYTYRYSRLQSRFAQFRCRNSETCEPQIQHLPNTVLSETACAKVSSFVASCLTKEGGRESRASKTNRFPIHSTGPSHSR